MKPIRPGLVLWMVQGKGGGQKHKDFVELKPKNSIACISQIGKCLQSATIKSCAKPSKKSLKVFEIVFESIYQNQLFSI